MREKALVGKSYIKQLSQTPNSVKTHKHLFNVKELAFIIPPLNVLAWLKLQRTDRADLSDRTMTSILCSALSPHRQNIISVINTESSQEATGLVKDE